MAQDSSTSIDANVSKAMDDVQDTLGQLARVTIAIRKAGASSCWQKADASFDFNDPQSQALRRHLEILLLAKPSENGTLQARESRQGVILYSAVDRNVEIDSKSLSKITKRLIEANLRRRNRFLYAQLHAETLSNRVKAQDSESQDTLHTMKPSRSPILSVPAGRKDVKEEPVNVESTTTATAVQGMIIMPAHQTIKPVTTVISVTTSRIRYPNPPAVKMDQTIFQCPCCCQVLPIAASSGNLWK